MGRCCGVEVEDGKRCPHCRRATSMTYSQIVNQAALIAGLSGRLECAYCDWFVDVVSSGGGELWTEAVDRHARECGGR